jgi:hypothetical protein
MARYETIDLQLDVMILTIGGVGAYLFMLRFKCAAFGVTHLGSTMVVAFDQRKGLLRYQAANLIQFQACDLLEPPH